jgi:hypothetical protein
VKTLIKIESIIEMNNWVKTLKEARMPNVAKTKMGK